MPGWRSTLKFPAFDVLTKCYSKCLTSLLSYVLSEYSTNIIGKSSRPRLSLFMSKFRISQHSMNMISTVTRTRLRRVKTLGQHQWMLQSYAQHQLWISTLCIFHKFREIMPGWNYPASLVNQNVILIQISYWRPHTALIMSLMST